MYVVKHWTILTLNPEILFKAQPTLRFFFIHYKIPILDNDTRNTRTFYTFTINLKSKVVLANIPGHFLVADRRPNILYAKLRRNCTLLKYDLFRSNIITDSRCVWRKWEASSLLNPQTHLESVIILDRNRSYFSKVQLRRNFAYKILGLLSATKKWPWILASTTLLLG
jgi:hypothetical protein